MMQGWFSALMGSETSDWILATGDWNDSGFWRDDENWVD